MIPEDLDNGFVIEVLKISGLLSLIRMKRRLVKGKTGQGKITK